MFKLLRYYAIASLACVLVAGALLTTLYRSESQQAVARIAEAGNLALGHALLNSVRGKLVNYVDGVAQAAPEGPATLALPSELASAIADLMRDTTVVKVKIFNRAGVVVYSTQSGEAGVDQRNNPGFNAAIGGQYVSTIVHRDAFNSFDQVTEDANLLHTYLPIRDGESNPIRGVFEIYADVSPLVAQNQRTLFVILGGAALVLTLLYGALLLVVRRADSIIESQQGIIRERTERLEGLTAQLLKNGESQRKDLAMELHEGLAQTLSAVKLKVEMAARGVPPGGADADKHARSIVELLQAAIEATRNIASALRPSSLDDFGLLPTIAWFCRKLNAQYPNLRVAQHIAIDEDKVPPALELVIFRIVESALQTLASEGHTDRIELGLTGTEGAIQLSIEATTTLSTAGVSATATREPADLGGDFLQLHERTVQSGGSFTATRNATGGFVLRASWPG